jgi:hypothetical protein
MRIASKSQGRKILLVCTPVQSCLQRVYMPCQRVYLNAYNSASISFMTSRLCLITNLGVVFNVSMIFFGGFANLLIYANQWHVFMNRVVIVSWD